MKKTTLWLIAILTLAILASGCAGSTATPNPQRSALETAKLTYADAAITYEATMLTLVDLRQTNLITDAQWTRIDQAQAAVQKWAPIVRSSLDLWESTGTEPVSYAIAIAKLFGAFAEVTAVKSEVK